MTHKTLGQIADPHVNGQDDEEALKPDFGDLLGSNGPQDRADGNADKLGADDEEIYRNLPDNHHVKDVDDHPDQDRQGRGAGDDEHGQAGNRGQERHIEETAADADQGRDPVDDEAAQERPEGVEGEFLAVKGEVNAAEAPLLDLDAPEMFSGSFGRFF